MMAYNLKGIRDALFAQADWAPKNSVTAVREVDQFINRAYLEMAMDAPFLFWKKTEDVEIYGTISGEGATAYSTSDPTTVQLPSTVVLDANQRWYGRTLVLPSANGGEQRFRIMTASAPSPYLFVDRPHFLDTTVGVPWRVEDDVHLLPKDLMQLTDVLVAGAGVGGYPLPIRDRLDADVVVYDPLSVTSGVVTGRLPTFAFRGDPIYYPAPTVAPALTYPVNGSIFPVGTDFCYTYYLGRLAKDGERDVDTIWYETPPSPISTATGVGLGSVVLSFPSIVTEGKILPMSYVEGSYFAEAGVVLYARFGGLGDFYRVAILTTVRSGSWSVDEVGLATFGKRYPLVPSGMRQTFGLYPGLSADGVVQVRYVATPAPLTSDLDFPHITNDAVGALIYKALTFLYESHGNMGAASTNTLAYNRALQTLTKRYGDMKPASQIFHRKIARL
jgi:hypothetical protein